jgi:uncharacterized metal-binding protein
MFIFCSFYTQFSKGLESKIRKSAMSSKASSRFLWAPWARNQALGAHSLILLGGIISLFYPNRAFALANIILPIFLMLLELEFPPLKLLGFMYHNLFLRSIYHTIALVPAFMQAPTYTGGLCLICCVLTYLRAAVNKETPYKEVKKSPKK